MKKESLYYTISQNKSINNHKFTGDNTDKGQRATEPIKLWAGRILDPTYIQLEQASMQAMRGLVPELDIGGGGGGWSSVSALPASPVTIKIDTHLRGSATSSGRSISNK